MQVRSLRWVPLYAAALCVAALCAAIAGPASAAGLAWVEPLRGHLSVGYSQLLIENAPGGNISFAGGIDLPVTTTLRAGMEVGVNLLGGKTVSDGSLLADLDYSALEILALAHWQPAWRGPIGRVSFGPGLVAARADLSSIGAAQFESLGVREVAPAVAAGVTLMKRSPAPVRVGLEANTRFAFVSNETWTLIQARLVFHY